MPGVAREVVITGVGVVAPGGVGAKQFWQLLAAGRTATRTISLFDATGFRSRVAAEVDFDPLPAGLTAQERDRHDRVVQFALVSAREAIVDSGLEFDTMPPDRLGVALGSAVGNTMRLEQNYCTVSDRGRNWLVDNDKASPYLYEYLVPSSIPKEVALDCGAEGPVSLVSNGCTAGIDAVGYAAQLIAEGSADVMIAGAADAPISPITTACFDAINATTPDNDDPEHASRPFDLRRNGFVLGEGAAALVLEEATAARRRGAQVYARIGGFSSRSNAFHMTGLKPDGREMTEAIRRALGHARLDPSEVDYVNAHGSGTPQNDRHETGAFKASLGAHAYDVPISSLKSMVGHSLGAIGSIELVACVLAMTNDVVPPTANLDVPDPDCDLDYVPHVARARKIDAVLKVGSGFGGFQSAIVLTRHGGR
ncbi:beta-ketoacyl-[acyl-carrier-protein] synthase family protein [Amycolatopsis balhimycina DSM 5908]|uniref:Beta-ketoacyl-[acyl-carrier-protein] synthase family protein n=2 Tax=Amycolatopsis balhimycina TaxID=208443 RepID=A0A428WPF2_AMYBA|nr:beta-ketoacyl-[acyl-carrier-protein] synthase family protein [Amycolatopsis balhimycina DSM 5908]